MNQKISPRPSLPKRGKKTSLWQREVGRDFTNNVVILRLLISFLSGYTFTPETRYHSLSAQINLFDAWFTPAVG